VGISFLFVTHDQEEAMVMSDRIALLRTGELEQVATPREIYNRPATAYTAQFIGHTNLLRGEVRNGLFRSKGLSWRTNLQEGSVLLSLRPENIRQCSEHCKSTSDVAVRFRGKVKQKAFHGATELLRVECADGLTLSVRTASPIELHGEVEWEFQPEDAVAVRESQEGS
jgi:ABC-type Fe3+/spermidine/putrescine transport system ATPase subunit